MSEIEKQMEYKKYPPTNDMVFKKLFGEDTEDTKKVLKALYVFNIEHTEEIK